MQTFVPECQYFVSLSEANMARWKEGIMKNSLNEDRRFWMCKLIEEVGELSQCFTKEKSIEALSEEIGDVRTVLNLLSQLCSIDDELAAKYKFNQTSEAKGSLIRVKI